jgi:hypothetical protein
MHGELKTYQLMEEEGITDREMMAVINKRPAPVKTLGQNAKRAKQALETARIYKQIGFVGLEIQTTLNYEPRYQAKQAKAGSQ